MSRQERRALQRKQLKEARKQYKQEAQQPSSFMSASPAHSGGPRTPEGKAASSQNAFAHGLTAARLVLPNENQGEFDALLDGLYNDHKPATITESILVREMAESYWRLNRARTREHALNLAAPSVDSGDRNSWEKQLALTERYARTFERSFHKCLNLLRKLQGERRRSEAEIAEGESAAQQSVSPSEFVSQKSVASAETPEPIAPDSFEYKASGDSETAVAASYTLL